MELIKILWEKNVINNLTNKNIFSLLLMIYYYTIHDDVIIKLSSTSAQRKSVSMIEVLIAEMPMVHRT